MVRNNTFDSVVGLLPLSLIGPQFPTCAFIFGMLFDKLQRPPSLMLQRRQFRWPKRRTAAFGVLALLVVSSLSWYLGRGNSPRSSRLFLPVILC